MQGGEALAGETEQSGHRERSEEQQQGHVQPPQPLAQQRRAGKRQMGQHQGEDAGAHRGGEPVGREAPDDLYKAVLLGEKRRSSHT